VGPTPKALVVLACATAALTGCGASDRKPDAAAVAERFQTALENQDGAAACAEVSDQAKTKLEQQEKAPCAQSILRIDLPAGGIAAKTSVYITSAAVHITTGPTTFLDEGPDGWKISAAGCEPTGPRQPFQCELEG
jgi:hypothetical protein